MNTEILTPYTSDQSNSNPNLFNTKTQLQQTKFINHLEIQQQQNKKQLLFQAWQNVNSLIQLNSQFKMGNPFIIDFNQIQKTINLIKHLIYSRQKQKQIFIDLNRTIKQLQNDKYMLIRKCENLQKQKMQEKQGRIWLINQGKNKQKSYKEMQLKLNAQKQQVMKQLNKIINKQLQYVNDIRRKEVQIKHLQQTVSKNQSKNLSFKNSIQMGRNLALNYEFQGQQNIMNFEKTIQKNYINRLQIIENENNMLKQILSCFVKQFNEIMVCLMMNNKKDGSYKAQFVKITKYNEQNLKQFNEQIIRFKNHIKNLNNFICEQRKQSSKNKQKVTDLQYAKKIINQQRILIHSQDNIIKNVIAMISDNDSSNIIQDFDIKKYIENNTQSNLQQIQLKIQMQQNYINTKENTIKQFKHKLKQKIQLILKAKQELAISKQNYTTNRTIINQRIAKLQTKTMEVQ